MKEKYADKLYESKEYYAAAEVYSELADKTIKSGSPNYTYCSRAGESAMQKKDYVTAARYYGQISIDKLSVQDAANYFQTLLVCQKYDDALQLSKQRVDLRNMLPAADAIYAGYVEDLKKDSSSYVVVDIPLNSNSGDFGLVLAGGKAWFASTRKPVGLMAKEYAWDNSYYMKIYTADQTGDFTFGAAELSDLSSKYHDGPVTFSPDGHRMLVTRNNRSESDGFVHFSLVEYELSSSGEWLERGAFKYNVPGKNTGQAFWSTSGRLYFVSDRDGGFGGSDVYYCDPKGKEWKEPVNAGKLINTIGDEFFPAEDKQGNLFFSSNGWLGLGGFDVFCLAKAAVSASNIGYPVNSSRDDIAYLPVKDDLAYFSSDRGNGVDRMYGLRIQPAIGTLLLSVLDADSQKSVTPDKAWLIDESGKRIPLEKTGTALSAAIERGKKYVVEVEKNNYRQQGKIEFGTENLRNKDTVLQTGSLELQYVDVDITIREKTTKETLSGVSGSFTDNTGNQVKFVSDSTGHSKVKLPVGDYALRAGKKGYLDFSDRQSVEKSESMILDLDLTAIKKNITFEVENILYDFSKYDLRPESMTELDKLAEFLILNDNIVVELSSHTDSRGSSKSNEVLSQKRAESCVNYLVSKGVSSSRIVAKGYGENKLLNKCNDGAQCSEEEHQMNRRTEIKILEVKL